MTTANRSLRKIPATVITGFLGAGKTTLIRHLLENAQGRRIALIINEFGDVGVDGGLLEGCAVQGCAEAEAGDIVELANGCLCCTVADEFLPTMRRLLARPTPPDHIVVETSGLALPKPLVKAFGWPEVRARVTVDGVITLADARACADGLFAADPEAVQAQRAEDPALDHDTPLEEVFDDQLACADLVVLNKADLLDEAEQNTLRARLAAALRPGVKMVATRHGRVDPAVVLGLAASAEDDLAARPSRHDAHDGEHDHDDFESFVLDLAPVADPAAFAERVRAAVARHGILRVKGFLDVPGKALRHVVQGVGERVEGYYDRPWRPGEERNGRVVVIGLKGLDREAIDRAFGG